MWLFMETLNLLKINLKAFITNAFGKAFVLHFPDETINLDLVEVFFINGSLCIMGSVLKWLERESEKKQ